MTMQRGFGAAPTVAPAPNEGEPLLGSGIFHISNTEGKNRRTTILLDDEPVWGYRHKIKRPYTPGKPSGDWKERDIRVTCAVASDNQDHPRECLLCEAAIRHGDIIKRVFTANLTCIDVGEHRTQKGAVYHDLKKLLEVDWTAYETFREQKKAMGSLVGMAFSVMRPTGDAKQSKTYGVWTPLQRVNLQQHFFASPAVRNIMEMAGKRGERLTQADAVQRLITPIDYNKELNNYTPQLAERFVMRAVSRAGATASDGFQGAPPVGTSFQNQPQFQGAPTMQPHAAPDYSVPPQAQQPFQGFPAPQQGFGGSVPPPPPSAGGQQGYQQPAGFAPQGPPQVGNPMGSTMPQGMNLPPPQAQPQPTLAPWASQPPLPGQPQHGFNQQQPAQPQMPMGQPAPQPQATPNYGFEQAPGWSAAFPGQPQQPMMQQPMMQQQPQQGYQPMPQQQIPQPQAVPGFGQQPGQGVPPPPARLPF
jgi:hypothetical protein